MTARNALTLLQQDKTEINWRAFSDYLRANFSRETVDLRMLYAKRHYPLLLNKDLSPPHQLTADTRLTAMKSLANLSKFLGCYEEWRTQKAKPAEMDRLGRHHEGV